MSNTTLLVFSAEIFSVETTHCQLIFFMKTESIETILHDMVLTYSPILQLEQDSDIAFDKAIQNHAVSCI